MSVDRAYFTVGATVSTYDIAADASDPAQDRQLGAAWTGVTADWTATTGETAMRLAGVRDAPHRGRCLKWRAIHLSG
ncbi:hypothetical protein [Streptomyces prunicolor]|uniref:hypothetical protein n=1 Tax=Streptomyces prunicolor TaxID=67348 RepID=UPI00343FF90A